MRKRPTANPPGLAEDAARAKLIAARNDEFRRSTPVAHISPGIKDLGTINLMAIMEAVRTFDLFTPADDPSGKHEGARLVVMNGYWGGLIPIVWKIDTFSDDRLAAHADDPLSHAAVRVLTITHAADVRETKRHHPESCRRKQPNP